MDSITPYSVQSSSKSGFDYQRLCIDFGLQELPDIPIFNSNPHPFITRGIIFAQLDLSDFSEHVIHGNPGYLYTGRGPSASMHLGHLVPFMFTKYLQDIFDIKTIIQISDDEKIYMKNLSFDEIDLYMKENVKDIIACGFYPQKTFIFSNMDYPFLNRRLLVQLKKATTFNTIKGTFGFNDSSSIGQLEYPCQQEAPAFSEYLPRIFNCKAKCLVPMGVDQYPFFRLARDIPNSTNKLLKPAVIAGKFLPSLKGGDKMSSSISDSGINLTDTPDMISKKILTSFSGGAPTLQEHREKGGNPDVDSAYQYLRFFEPDEHKLIKIHDAFKSGQMTSREIKNIAIELIVKIIGEHQLKRSKIDNLVIEQFFSDIGKNTF